MKQVVTCENGKRIPVGDSYIAIRMPTDFRFLLKSTPRTSRFSTALNGFAPLATGLFSPPLDTNRTHVDIPRMPEGKVHTSEPRKPLSFLSLSKTKKWVKESCESIREPTESRRTEVSKFIFHAIRRFIPTRQGSYSKYTIHIYSIWCSKYGFLLSDQTTVVLPINLVVTTFRTGVETNIGTVKLIETG